MKRHKYVGSTLQRALELASTGLQSGAVSAKIEAQHAIEARTGQVVIVAYGVTVEAEENVGQSPQQGGCSCKS